VATSKGGPGFDAMPVELPDLDDRRYADLVQEGLTLIPVYSPEWTNHNPSDPGITLMELFAYLTDVFLYRLNRVSDANRTKFLKLLTGEQPPETPESLDNALREAILAVRKFGRAITREDFERLSREATNPEQPDHQVKRACCFPRRDLDGATVEERQRDRPGHTSVVFVPAAPWADERTVDAIRNTVREYLEPRRLLTSRLHVSGPRYVDVSLRLRIVVLAGSSKDAVGQAISRELSRLFHPLEGGPEGTGWPFGRSVYTSDVYRVVEAVDGVDYISAAEFDVADAARVRRSEFDEVIEVRLWPEELVRVRVSGISFGTAAVAAGGGAAR
jgi:hypothetical protein